MDKKKEIELIEIDAYNLMISYLSGQTDLKFFQNGIIELSKLGFYEKEKLVKFLKDRTLYEASQTSIGKEEDERNQIKKRMQDFMDN